MKLQNDANLSYEKTYTGTQHFFNKKDCGRLTLLHIESIISEFMLLDDNVGSNFPSYPPQQHNETILGYQSTGDFMLDKKNNPDVLNIFIEKFAPCYLTS